ncbi:hypothetical protein IWZ01DRAFT_568758 [Phyllosticta capitalensis]
MIWTGLPFLFTQLFPRPVSFCLFGRFLRLEPQGSLERQSSTVRTPHWTLPSPPSPLRDGIEKVTLLLFVFLFQSSHDPPDFANRASSSTPSPRLFSGHPTPQTHPPSTPSDLSHRTWFTMHSNMFARLDTTKGTMLNQLTEEPLTPKDAPQPAHSSTATLCAEDELHEVGSAAAAAAPQDAATHDQADKSSLSQQRALLVPLDRALAAAAADPSNRSLRARLTAAFAAYFHSYVPRSAIPFGAGHRDGHTDAQQAALAALDAALAESEAVRKGGEEEEREHVVVALAQALERYYDVFGLIVDDAVVEYLGVMAIMPRDKDTDAAAVDAAK